MFSFIDKTLKENGINPLASIPNNQKVTKVPVSESTKLKESDITFNELDSIVESAIKETSNNIIMESFTLEANKKLEMSNAINRSKIDDVYAEKFMQETIDPIINTVGTLTEDARILYTIKNPKSVTSVSLPVYEVALTLEAARCGALTEESLNYTKAVKEDVDPTIMDLHGATAEASASKSGKVDEDEQSLADLVDQDECETYDMGEEAVKQVNEEYDPHDVHQYEDNDSKMYELDKGSEPSQAGMFSDDPDFSSDSDIDDYEGETAGDPTKGGNFPDTTMPVVENSGTRLARLMFGEDCGTDKVNYVPTSDSDIDDYEGEVAGDEGPGANASDEFEGDGSSDEAIVEGQIYAARLILTQIFNEYGIDSFERRKAIVREAIHYNLKYGATNLFPATSDVASLVVEQNNISEIDGHHSAKHIVENTSSVLNEAQESLVEAKSIDYINALAASKRHGLNEQTKIMKAVNFITRTSLIERTRQAFRCRMHFFSEEVKAQVCENWTLDENANKVIDKNIVDNINSRNYISEAPELKEYLTNLEENSPIYKPSWKKSSINNDALTSASIFTEVVFQWMKIKDELYNNKPIQEKYIALKAMSKLHEVYKNLCSTMRDSSKAINLIENHSFRLNNLLEKVEYILKTK